MTIHAPALATITTKYLGPSNTRGARVKATCQAGNVTMGWDYDHDQDENHRAAAVALAAKVNWDENYPDMVGGWTETGAVFVFAL